jgi:hypothetical protein
MSSPLNRAEHTLAAITGHLWVGAHIHALMVVENLISVNRATPNQVRVNGAGYEIEIDSALSQAYSLPNLGASDGVFTNDTERRWLGRLRRYCVKNDFTVVRKWQNRLIFLAREDRDVVRDLARVLAGWIVEDFARRHVTEVEQATLTISGDREPITRVEHWHLFTEDGREVTPSGRDAFHSFLDAVYVATEIKHGTPGARYLRRPICWGTI